MSVNRRTLLAGGLLAGLGIAGAGYVFTVDDSEAGTETVPEDHVPFSVWAEQREAIRTSSDHLSARTEQLLEGDDLEALFVFVRDEIATVPSGSGDFDASSSVVRWGARGALRSGTGTPRDKAELLASLYREAGYESSVVVIDVSYSDVGLTPEYVTDHTLRNIDHEFDPDVDDETRADWYDRLDTDTPEVPEFTDADGTEGKELAATVREFLSNDAIDAVDEFHWRWGRRRRSGQIPIVEVVDDGEIIYANLFLDAPFGELLPEDTDETAADVEEPPDPDVETVTVTLTAATPNDLSTDGPFELVSGEWEVPDLVGRQLLVRTPPTLDPFEFPTVSIQDVNTFVPVLGLQAIDTTDEEMSELSAFGDAFTIKGDRLSVDLETEGGEITGEDETVLLNGEEMYNPDVMGDPSTVADLEITATATEYPFIELRATPTDDAGEYVEGLTGNMFKGIDENEDVVPTMVSNSAQPTILLLRDDSASMARGPLGDLPLENEWYDNLESAIESAIPDVYLETREVDSDIWTHLTSAIAESRDGFDGPDLVIYAHDGIPADELTDSMIPTLEDAPPTVLISAHDEEAPIEDETVLEQVELMGAEAVPFGEWELIESVVSEELKALSVPYRLEYHVPDDERGERTVELTVGANSAESEQATASTNYETPSNSVTTTIVGLYLTVEVGDRSVTRTLGGYDPVLDGGLDSESIYGSEASESDIAEYGVDVRNAIFGGVDISFEGDGVPYGAALDDFLSALLSRETLAETTLEGDLDDQRAALQEGFMEIPWELMQVQATMPNAVSEEGVTYFDGPRIAMMQEKPNVYSMDEDLAVKTSVDVLPLSRAWTATEDPADGFRLTMDRTASIAVAEREAFDESTASLLDDVALIDSNDESIDDIPEDQLDEFDLVRERFGTGEDDHRLIPADGSARAFWNVDKESGTLLGVLDNATGGGNRYARFGTVSNDRFDRMNEVISEALDHLERVGAISGMGATSLGVVAEHYAGLAKLYAQVAAVIAAAMDATEIGGDLREELLDMIRQIVRSFGEGVAGV
jgi:hypothetical protein